ncbi:MAG: twin-arginine translocase subunit TatC [Caldilineae bacterium]|nr:MAG: twin-arginine translocase subunit TatC [Caldilineae bacterium]
MTQNNLDSEIETLAGQMTLLEHLEELRRRLIIVSVAVLITTLASFAFAQQLVDLLARPIGGIQMLESIDVTENITVFMKVSLMGGFILAMPVILFQLIAFIVPGLTKSERRSLFIIMPAATLLFLSGVAFAYFVMLPRAVPFLLQFLGIPTAPRPQSYFSFVTRLIFWIGASFELPLVMAFLSRLGVVTPQFLSKNFRYAIVIIAIMAALITPTPDPLNMSLVMAPLLLLYGIGLVLAKIMYRPREPVS